MSAPELLDDPLLDGVPVVDGFKVLDRCVLYARLGQGGMGSVYRGRHLNLEVEVAVKCLKKSLAEEDEEFIARFQREAKVAASISSENLIRVFDVGFVGGVHYLIMEFVAGENLTDRVRRKGPLSPVETATIGWAACRGLGKAHAAGIIHRDIKPDNIMISEKGEVKVADLGLARAAHGVDSLKTRSSLFMGTPQYSPPEQFRGASEATAASDVFSMGATLYQLLSGAPPFRGDSIQEIMFKVSFEAAEPLANLRPDCPPELVAIIDKAMQKDASLRYRTGEEMGEALEGLLRKMGQTVRLADPEAGRRASRAGLVSPPPDATWARIKSAISDKGSRVDSRRTEVGRSNEDAIPTVVPNAGGLASTVSAERRRVEAPSSRRDPAPAPDYVPTVLNTPPKKGKAGLVVGVAAAVVLTGVGAAFFFRGDGKKDDVGEKPKVEKKADTENPPLKKVDDSPIKPIEPEKKIETPTKKEPVVKKDDPPKKVDEKKNDVPARFPIWAREDKGVPVDAAGNPLVAIEKTSGIEMVLVPAGTFFMGSAKDGAGADPAAQSDEMPRRKVTISRAFYLSKYEITNAQFRELLPAHAPRPHEGMALGDDRRPAVYISWNDAAVFAKTKGMRLPTEAEWEYAARAGSQTPFSWGDRAELGEGFANVADLSARAKWSDWDVVGFDDRFPVTSPVGSFKPNAFGLYDMIGNVREWVADFYDDSGYGSSADATDPKGASSGDFRVARGGSWMNDAGYLRSAARWAAAPDFRGEHTGFRLAADL